MLLFHYLRLPATVYTCLRTVLFTMKLDTVDCPYMVKNEIPMMGFPQCV